MSRSLSPADFALMRDYLRQTAGLEFDEGRKSGLSAVVNDRLSAAEQPDVESYLAVLQGSDGAAERQRLLDAVTIRETHFHRSKPQIDALRGVVLPEVLTRAAQSGRPVTVWSAGCATGEEPYTLAMLMLEAASGLAESTRAKLPDMRVVGTDVSSTALHLARSATYSGRTIALADPAAVLRWLRKERDGSYTVRDQVRSMVEFAHHNLVTDELPFARDSIDLVVCRHVTIYFGRETTRALVHRFHSVLHPGGWLLLGPAESLFQVTDEFALESVGEAFAYRSLAGPAKDAAVPSSVPRPRGARPARPTTGPAAGQRAQRQSSGTMPARDVPAQLTAAGTNDLLAARTAFETGDYAGAERGARLALAAAPVDADAYLLLGHAKLNQGDAASAVESLQRAVFLDPRAGHAHFLMAVALSSAGRPGQAAVAYRAAAETLPDVDRDTVRRMLEGRQPEELVQLCRRLADEAESEADNDAVRRGA